MVVNRNSSDPDYWVKWLGLPVIFIAGVMFFVGLFGSHVEESFKRKWEASMPTTT